MANDYSEGRLIEHTCIQLLQELGWDTADVYHGENFGAYGAIGRDTEADVILRARFNKAIRTLNPGLPAQAYETAYQTITDVTVMLMNPCPFRY